MFYEPDREPHGLAHNPFKSCIVPRPIGWITTLKGDGKVNLAPFSQFNLIGYEPGYVGFSASVHPPDWRGKDSVQHVERSGEFVYNMATYDLRDKVDPSVFLDPFHGGRQLTALDCRRMHRAMSGGGVWSENFLNPVSKLSIVARVLGNLKGVAIQRHDPGTLLWVMTLRQAIPGLAEQEQAEFQQVRARFN